MIQEESGNSSDMESSDLSGDDWWEGRKTDALKVGANFCYICTIVHDQDSSSQDSSHSHQPSTKNRAILPEVFVPYLVQGKAEKDFLIK